MRQIVCVSVALLSGCPGSSMPGSGTEDGPGTSEAETEPPPGSTSEAEPATTAVTTTGPIVPEGLFTCQQHAPCDRWDCADGCDGPGPVGMCVLGALYDRTAGPIEVVRCDVGCSLHRLLPRGLGTDEVRVQWRSQTKPPAYSEISDCMLQPPEFFEACLIDFTPECADPAAWVTDCYETAEACEG